MVHLERLFDDLPENGEPGPTDPNPPEQVPDEIQPPPQ